MNFPPYFYSLREIGNRVKLDLPKRSYLIKALHLLKAIPDSTISRYLRAIPHSLT